MMPVLLNWRERPYAEKVNCPRTVPMNLFTETWADKNHGQTLARLAQRGGLGPLEMIAIMDKMSFWKAQERFPTNEAAMDELMRRLQELEAG